MDTTTFTGALGAGLGCEVEVELSPEIGAMRAAVRLAADAELGGFGLAAGLRPAADVTALLELAAAAEYTLARHMHAASTAGALPLPGAGAMATSRAWSPATARRLARAGALAAEHPTLARAWAAGLISAEHVDAVARAGHRLTPTELAAVLTELEPLWGQLPPAAVARFVTAAVRVLHPPGDPTPDERDAYAGRALSFSLLGDTVLLAGTLPRLEGEALIAAVDAVAERLRSQADHTPAAARRADALIQLVNDAHATGALPTRGGLPTALTVTLEHPAGHCLATTSRGHLLTPAEIRFTTCDAAITPVLTAPSTTQHGGSVPPPQPGTPGATVAALAAALLGTREPLAVGRTARTATPAQRRALALRDRGCVIPGCQVPAEATQVHHLTEWAAGGATDLPTLVLLCWPHHRQVDLGMWTITPTSEPPPHSTLTWPGNNDSPWTITTRPRSRWRI